MIVVDSSVFVAICENEPGSADYLRRIAQANTSAMSVANFVESSNVIEGRRGLGGQALFESEFQRLQRLGLFLATVDVDQANGAREAFRRYGKGRHPASLNFGDCFAYALAKALDAPLLFKGADFAKTDLKRA